MPATNDKDCDHIFYVHSVDHRVATGRAHEMYTVKVHKASAFKTGNVIL